MMYEEDFCNRCVHQKPDGEGCAVWLAHLLYSYQECNSDSNAAHILELLIPRSKDKLGNDECRMFHLDPNAPDPNQMSLF